MNVIYDFDLTGFVLDAENRREAYENHMEFEKGQRDGGDLMSYRAFCMELNKGYGVSEHSQIARLYEAPDGKIWYDTEFCG